MKELASRYRAALRGNQSDAVSINVVPPVVATRLLQSSGSIELVGNALQHQAVFDREGDFGERLIDRFLLSGNDFAATPKLHRPVITTSLATSVVIAVGNGLGRESPRR